MKMNPKELFCAMSWMLSEAQSYIGSQWINDPHEAAKRIAEYFDELKKNDLEKYVKQINAAMEFGKARGNDFWQ